MRTRLPVRLIDTTQPARLGAAGSAASRVGFHSPGTRTPWPPPAGPFPPLGGSLPSTAGRAPSLRQSTSLPLRSRASHLALCVHARGQLGLRLSLFGLRQWPKRFDEFSVRHAALNPSYTRRGTSWRSRLRFPAPRHFVITWHNAIWGCPLFRSVLL